MGVKNSVMKKIGICVISDDINPIIEMIELFVQNKKYKKKNNRTYDIKINSEDVILSISYMNNINSCADSDYTIFAYNSMNLNDVKIANYNANKYEHIENIMSKKIFLRYNILNDKAWEIIKFVKYISILPWDVSKLISEGVFNLHIKYIINDPKIPTVNVFKFDSDTITILLGGIYH